MPTPAVRIAPVLLVLVAAVCGPAVAADKKDGKKKHIPFSDEAVTKAIEKGRAYLLGKQNADGSWRDPGGGGLQIVGDDRKIAGTALFVYSLLTAGVDIKDERLVKALDWLEKQRSGWNYAVSMRCMAWQAAYKADPGQAKYRALLRADAMALIKAAARGTKTPGSYGYRIDYRVETDNRTKRMRRSALKSSDPSNGQYGVLGVWASHQLYGEVPRRYWEVVLKYWLSEQRGDGGWAYKDSDKNSTATMTAAGVATMFVCIDALFGHKFVRCDQPQEIPQLNKALAWFDRNFPKSLKDDELCHGGHGGMYYYLFGVERVGLASGYRYFGKADWHKLGASWLLNEQNGNGSWKGRYGDLTSTAYALLFLARGQHGVLFNRLEYNGDWNNRPRALANLCRWVGKAFEQDLYWQIVNLRTDVEDWHDGPILVITGSTKPKFSDGDVAKLRQYVHEGGTLFTIAECNGEGFREGVDELAKKLFPGRSLTDITPDHALYTAQERIRRDLEVSVVSNGVRPLLIHTDQDLAVDWQLNRFKSAEVVFELAANVAMYVTGRHLRHRGEHGWPDEPRRSDGPTVTIAPIRHGGNWRPEPLAWQRLARRVGAATDVNVEVAEPVAAAELKAAKNHIASLTGTEAFQLDQAGRDALKAYVEGGGLLLVHAAGGWTGGGKAFAESAEAMLYDLYGRRSLRTLASMHDLYRMKGHEIDRPRYHLKTKTRLGGSVLALKGVMVDDDTRLGVLFSREDLITGLIGCTPLPCDGFLPQTAYDLARNAVLYAAGKHKQKPEPKNDGGKKDVGK